MSPETRATGSEPVRRGEPRSEDVLVIHPASGEVLGRAHTLETLPPEVVAEARLALKERMTALRKMLEVVDNDIARRLEIRGRKKMAVGEHDEYEISYQPRRESVWDADELEYVIREMLDRGAIAASEVTGLITHETTVSRSTANRLVDRLSGEERRAVEACRTWREASRRNVDVVRSLELFKP